MTKKNILVVCPTSIYPIEMGTQIRFLNLIRRLSQDHLVDVVCKVPGRAHLSSEFVDQVKPICHHYYPILAPNKKNLLARLYYRMRFELAAGWRAVPSLLFYNSLRRLERQISRIANSQRYDVINSEYWYTCSFLKHLTYKPYLALDTININYEKHEKSLKLRKRRFDANRKLRTFRDLELEFTGLNDLIISISEQDRRVFAGHFPAKTHYVVPGGQNLDKYIAHQTKQISRSVLFYGNISKDSLQNHEAFWTLYNQLYPRIKKRVRDCRLLVVGANPTEDIKKLRSPEIEVTGFVQDISDVISQASVFLLPLKSGGGFRTRVVEVMALGVPVVGTHNALDCIELEHGVQGYVTDSLDEMAEFGISLIINPELRRKMSDACKRFVSQKYSIDATYGRLSDFYLNLKLPLDQRSDPHPPKAAPHL